MTPQAQTLIWRTTHVVFKGHSRESPPRSRTAASRTTAAVHIPESCFESGANNDEVPFWSIQASVISDTQIT